MNPVISRQEVARKPTGTPWIGIVVIGCVLALAVTLIMVILWLFAFALPHIPNAADLLPDQEIPSFKLDNRFSLQDFKHEGAVLSLAFSPDGKYIAAGSNSPAGSTEKHWEGYLIIWDTVTRKELFRKQTTQWVVSLSFHPEGKYLAVSCSSRNQGKDGFLNFVQKPGEVIIYDFPNMREVQTVKFDVLTSWVAFSPDGQTLAVVNHPDPRTVGPGKISLLEFPALTERAAIGDVNMPMIIFTADSKELFAGVNEPFKDEIRMFDAGTGAFKSVVGGKIGPGYMQLTPDGMLMVLHGGGVSFHDQAKDRFPKEMYKLIYLRHAGTTKNGHIRGACLSPDKKLLFAVETKAHRIPRQQESTFLLENYDTQELITVFQEQEVAFNNCSLSTDCKKFAVGTDWYRGTRGKKTNPQNGHVLLFRREAK